MRKIIKRMLREIRQNMGQFFSLSLVIAIGSFMFAGLFSSITVIKDSVNSYYESQQLADIWVKFAGVSKEQISEWKEQLGIKAEGRYVTNIQGDYKGNQISIRLYSLTDMNAIYMRNGNKPVKENEIVIDSKFAKANDIKVGDVLISDDSKNSYTVCGIADNPENAWKIKDSFSGVTQNSSFVIAYGTEETVKEAIKSSKTYHEKYGEMMEQFDDADEQLLEEQNNLVEKKAEYEKNTESTYEQLEDSKDKLSDVREELDKANSELAQKEQDATAELTDMETSIQDAKNTVTQKQAELDDKSATAEVKYQEALSAMKAAEQQLAAKQAELDTAYQEYNKAVQSLEEQKDSTLLSLDNSIDAAKDAGNLNLVEELTKKREETVAQFAAMEEKLTEQKVALDQNKESLTASEESLQDQKKALEQQKKQTDLELNLTQNQLNDASGQIKSQESDLAIAKQFTDVQIQSAQLQLNEKENSYDNSVSQLEQQEEKAVESLDEAEENLNEAEDTLGEKAEELADKKQQAMDEFNNAMLDYSEILIKTENVNSTIEFLKEQDNFLTAIRQENHGSVKAVQGGMDIIRIIAYSIPIVFYLVAALISFITMSKMVENQRMQIAVMEAMGIKKIKIMMGYLSYAFFAVIIGSFSFALLGNLVLPGILTKMFSNRYLFPPITDKFYPVYILLPFILGLLFSSVAVIMAAYKTFREVPASAMRPKVPKKTKTILIEKITILWKHIGYSEKLILRNIFLNKRRILLSSIGVMGSVTLMITGLSLRNAANTVLWESEASIGYDSSILFNDGINQDIISACPYNLSETAVSATVKATMGEEKDNGILIRILPRDSNVIHLKDIENVPITLQETGLLIPSSLAEKNDLQIGDIVKIAYNEESKWMQISGIYQQYGDSTCYISWEYGDTIGLNVDPDEIYVTYQNKSETDKGNQYFMEQKNVKGIITRQEMTDSVGDNLRMLTVMILIILAAASILAITVIYNITDIHIYERTRELATLMVLGYDKNKVGKLVFTENMVITGVGYLLGLPAGVLLFSGILKSFENANVFLPHIITWPIKILTLTMVFFLSIGINMVLKRKLSKIDMVESLKGVE